MKDQVKLGWAGICLVWWSETVSCFIAIA